MYTPFYITILTKKNGIIRTHMGKNEFLKVPYTKITCWSLFCMTCGMWLIVGLVRSLKSSHQEALKKAPFV